MIVAHVLTVPASLRFLRGQPEYMRANGVELHVCCSPGPMLDRFAEEEGVTAHAVEMPRAITPGRDLRALRQLTSTLRRIAPDVVHAQTPKGGLLGVLGGRAARCPRVLYHMRGLPFMGATGTRRRLLLGTERVACGLADRVICQSRSLREVALAHRLVPAHRSLVLGPGGNGVDARGRFDPARYDGTAERLRLGIPASARVVGFVGRLVRDKGIVELADAWRGLSASRDDVHLLVVGPFEQGDPVPQDTRDALERDPRVHLIGETEQVAPMYAAMDVLALPTYREGFPNVPIEASSMAVPVVATEIPGCVDAVIHGRTGTLVQAKDKRALEYALARYLDEPSLRDAHGRAGREWAVEDLARERIWELLLRLYRP